MPRNDRYDEPVALVRSIADRAAAALLELYARRAVVRVQRLPEVRVEIRRNDQLPYFHTVFRMDVDDEQGMSGSTGISRTFLEPLKLVEDELCLVLEQLYPGDTELGWAPAYRFAITVREQNVGKIELRLSESDFVVQFATLWREPIRCASSSVATSASEATRVLLSLGHG